MSKKTITVEPFDYCPICGKPCGPGDTDGDGKPIHTECRIDREAARIDAAMEATRWT